MGMVPEKAMEQLYWVHVMEPDILGLECDFTMEFISFVSKTELK
jgi:hypothetical protein